LHVIVDQIRIIEHCAEGMAEGIIQLTTFVDRTGCFRRGVAGNSTRKGKLKKEFPKPGFVLTDVG